MFSEATTIDMKVYSTLSLFLFFTITGVKSLFSQDIRLEVIGSAGMYVTSPEGSMSWTLGEVTIDTYASPYNFLTQGFHQPEEGKLPILSDFFIPEGFSPNSDGINDVFFIRGIENYPNNSIQIFNRWGNKIFEAEGYKNNWDGKSKLGITVGGEDLPVGTYFYVFDFGDGSNFQKGTIYLNN